MRSPRPSGFAAVALLLSSCGEWNLFRRSEEAVDPVVVEESFAQAPLPAVDVLWVIDNSCSMAEEQTALATAFDSFIQALVDYDLAWQAGVIASDTSDVQAGVLRGNPWIVHPDLSDPTSAFGEAADVGTSPTVIEAGLDAAWLALNPPLSDSENIGFRRQDAALHVVIVSDGEDQSGAILGQDPVGAFAQYLADEAERTGRSAVLSAIIGLPPDGCDTAIPSERYAEVANLTGGVTGSICDADLGPVIAAIGEAGVDWPSSFALQASPATGSEAVWIDDERQPDTSYTLQAEPPALVFAAPPPPGSTIRIRYELPDEVEAP